MARMRHRAYQRIVNPRIVLRGCSKLEFTAQVLSRNVRAQRSDRLEFALFASRRNPVVQELLQERGSVDLPFFLSLREGRLRGPLRQIPTAYVKRSLVGFVHLR